MLSFERILCPVDLSKHSAASIELASSFASAHNAKLIFIYVAPYWMPDETLVDYHFILESMESDKKTFHAIVPTDPAIPHEHIFVSGNPGPEIVAAADESDMIVMSTHGHTGLVRLLVGSVAEYVMRHAPCPVITFKPPQVKNMKSTTPKSQTPVASRPDSQPQHFSQSLPAGNSKFVTTLMQHVAPIHSYQKMEEVIAELATAGQTAAPVIDEEGACIGILTKTDIERYRDLQERFAARDETVIDEIFETDEFGQRRAGNCNFDLVCKHYTAPVVTIRNQDSVSTAQTKFAGNDNIHHLVVVDSANRPIGIVCSNELSKLQPA